MLRRPRLPLPALPSMRRHCAVEVGSDRPPPSAALIDALAGRRRPRPGVVAAGMVSQERLR